MQYEMSKTPGEFKANISLQSMQENVKQLAKLSDNFTISMENAGFPKSDSFFATWAIVELGTNAMKHGNNWQPNKIAEISCVIGKDAAPKDYPGQEVAIITVEDEGGKNLTELPDPKMYAAQYQEKIAEALQSGTTENTLLDLPSGRGWATLIEKADKVTFEHTHRGLKVSAIFVKGSELRKKS
jgi:anti-sigma regulatory factor (Ser/Thr protein kinase)